MLNPVLEYNQLFDQIVSRGVPDKLTDSTNLNQTPYDQNSTHLVPVRLDLITLLWLSLCPRQIFPLLLNTA